MNSAMTKKITDYMTVADYLTGYCQDNAERYELVNGEVWAMGNTSKAHNILALNMITLLRSHLKGTSCNAYMECLKVRINDNFYFPDVVVDCGDNDDNYTVAEPTLIVEVLSNSTRRYDRVFKRHEYQKINTLQEYVLIEQEFKEITIFRRSKHWQSEIYYENETFYLASVELKIKVDDVYDDVTFEEIFPKSCFPKNGSKKS